MAQYASEQPAGYINAIKNVAIVGAAGNVGSFIVKSLLETGKHNITAITRAGSSSKIPDGVKAAEIDYEKPDTIVKALEGQDVIIISLSVMAPRDTQSKLIQAAADAGVPFVIPNQWGGDSLNKKLGEDIILGKGYQAARDQVEQLGKSSWIDINCSFWYEFSLGGTIDRYGFDFDKKEVVFYDDGEEKINTSTWPQTGRAVAALLSLKVLPDDADDKSATLSQFRNSPVRVSSFCVSQKDMFESVKRVTGTTDADWKISHVDSSKRWEENMGELMKGNALAFGRVLYTRIFFPTGEGNFEASRGLHNELLGLPKEDIDEATKTGIQLAKDGHVYGATTHT
ncbi:putative oxidoreductase CipA [Polychaeton citri CBS 116435]|uniref:Oxidoreductase CipA n=1 Tax=Polychaeton citri CBS 116435 TaxID=1314669 RepID=A0A9P4UJT7_9PEZI|nr:putative oxidoreductase CipA [Polychaeton citri CBS 116435]